MEDNLAKGLSFIHFCVTIVVTSIVLGDDSVYEGGNYYVII